MAEKRMFAKKVIESGRFLRMPPTSRLLYYDLGMAADDDGIVEAYSVIKMDGCTEDDLRVLVAKGFVRILNEDLVSIIMDWKMNNTIRADRYNPSIYAALLDENDNQLSTSCQPVVNQLSTSCQPVVNQMETEIKVKDKIKIKDNKERTKRFVPPTIEEVETYCKERNNGVNPRRWYDHYQAVGWKVGRNPMKDWKAAVRKWEEDKPKKEEYGEFYD